MDKLNKTYGTGSVLALDSATTGDYDVISTGVLVLIVTLGVGGFVKGKCMNLWAGRELVNLLYVDMPLQNVKKQVELFFILMERMLLIKIFSRISGYKNVASQPSCVRKDLT
jgi:hypothetical protein